MSKKIDLSDLVETCEPEEWERRKYSVKVGPKAVYYINRPYNVNVLRVIKEGVGVCYIDYDIPDEYKGLVPEELLKRSFREPKYEKH